MCTPTFVRMGFTPFFQGTQNQKGPAGLKLGNLPLSAIDLFNPSIQRINARRSSQGKKSVSIPRFNSSGDIAGSGQGSGRPPQQTAPQQPRPAASSAARSTSRTNRTTLRIRNQ